MTAPESKQGETMFKVTQTRNGYIVNVWFQVAGTAEEALQIVRAYYAREIKGSRFEVEEA